MTYAESVVHNYLAPGAELVSSGWPDFLARNEDGTVYAVEVKGPGDQLHGNQALVHEWLAAAGVTVFIAHVDKDDEVELVAADEPAADVPKILRALELKRLEVAELEAQIKVERLKRASTDPRALHVQELLTDVWQTAAEIGSRATLPAIINYANPAWNANVGNRKLSVSSSVAHALRKLIAQGVAESKPGVTWGSPDRYRRACS